ncbi:MAG: PKD domain-containing protein, partial [Xanthomonadales bacterium]|nr:PKD domain-containing protein [Xanthomonadales bacterium]
MKIFLRSFRAVVAGGGRGGKDGEPGRRIFVPEGRACALAPLLATLAIVLIPVGAMGQAADPYYIAVDLGVPEGGVNSSALGVNADGTVVVGQARVGTKNLPFVWRNGEMIVIGDPASMTSGSARSVVGTRDNFRVVGEYANAGLRRGFVYSSDGTFQDLPMIPGHEQSSAWSINADGKIAGYTYYDLGVTFNPRKQAFPVRWDPTGPSPSVSYSQPTILYNGSPLNYDPVQCLYRGRGFGIGNPIRLNDAPVPVVVTSWNVPTTNCFSQGTNINVLNYYAARPIKHSTADSDIGLTSWKGPAQPLFGAYAGYYPNQNIREYANTYGVAVNNSGTELHNEDAPLFQPGLTSRQISGYTWKEVGGTSTYTVAAGLQACNVARTLRYADVNDSDQIVGYTNVTGGGNPCVQISKGFVRPLGGSFRYLQDRVSTTCGWTRLLPSDITNDGHIVGGGLRSGAAGGHAFLLVPVDSLPADPTQACTAPPAPDTENEPPVANAGPDQTLEATSPEGAAVTLDGSASTDPEGDPLTFAWSTPVGDATTETASVTLPIGAHVVTLTVTDDKDASDTDTATVTVEDTTPPETIITSAPPPRTNSTTPAFSFEGADIATVPEALTFECSLDGGAFTACTSPTAYSGLADGEHQFAVRAVDGVGIWDPTPATHAWTQDTTPPETTITGAPAAITSAATATFTFLGADAQAPVSALTFECRLDGDAWAACASPTAYVGITDGAHQFAVRAADDLGNVDATPASRSWTMDATPPTIAIASPPDGVRFLVGASASASYSCNDAGSGIDSCVGTVADGGALDTFTPGSFALAVNAADKAGNSSSLSHTYTVGYGVCNHQEFGARRVGSVIPMKLQACDVSGA